VRKTRRDPNATVEMGQSTNIVLCMAMESLRRYRRVPGTRLQREKWKPKRELR
jgi:hypothetical protein